MPPPSRNDIINYVRCALKRISDYIMDCMASYYGAPANRLTATLRLLLYLKSRLLFRFPSHHTITLV